MNVISIINHKGGTGKTTTTLNLGRALSLHGEKVLLIDLDPQYNLTTLTNIEVENHLGDMFIDDVPLPCYPYLDNLDIVPSDLDLTMVEPTIFGDITKLSRLKSSLRGVEYDFVLIDCPPNLGVLNDSALMASSFVLIPVESDFLATKGLSNLLRKIEAIQESFNPNLEVLGLLMTKFDNTILSADMNEEVREVFEGLVFQTNIRKYTAVRESHAVKQTLLEYAPTHKSTQDYKNLALEILERLK